MKINNFSLIFIFIVFFCSNIFAQKNVDFLYGKWQIIDIKSLLEGSLNLSAEGYNQEIKDQKICKNSYVIILKDGIKYGNKKCRYYDCLSTYFKIVNYDVTEKSVIENLDSKYFEKNEIERLSNASYLHKKLKVIETNCFIDYGS